MGRWAEVEFDCEPPPGPAGQGAATAAEGGVARMVLDVDVFRVPPVLPGQNLLTTLNGLRVHSAYLTDRTTLEFRVRAEVLLPRGNRLTFDLPDAIRPLEFGMDDNRMLGVKLFSIAMDPAAAEMRGLTAGPAAGRGAARARRRASGERG